MRKIAAAVSLGKRRMAKLSPAQRSELGRLAAKARLSKLTPAQRSEIARKGGVAGAAARWGKRGGEKEGPR